MAHVQLSSKAEERRVIFASSLGTVFEWYDFYLYATLAPFFATLFFPKGNDTAALLSAFAIYAAGGRSAHSCSAGSATWSAASTRSCGRS
jgi:hypothetical protein